MGIRESLSRAWRNISAPPQNRLLSKRNMARYFAGAQLNKHLSFAQNIQAYHDEIKQNLIALRSHSRDLTQNSPWARRYVQMCSTHIVGEEGIILNSAVTGNGGKLKNDINDIIEGAYAEWSTMASADGKTDWVGMQQSIAQTVARDGECLVRLIRGYPNKFGFALELVDPDLLDWYFNTPYDSQKDTRTIMGIAQDKYGRNQGYWLWSCHPYDIEGRPQRTFVPARDLIHVYAQDRVRGVRGIPWMSAVHVSINMLGSLWTSELGNANAQSRIVGMITSKDGMTDPNEDPDSASADNPTGTGADPVAAAANIDIEDASFIGVPAGLEVTFPQSTSPNPALNAFTTELLRSIATGLGVSYHSLTGDVSQANYSSARVALIEERDGWRKQQKWFIAAVMEPVFKAWLEMAILSGAIQIPGWSFDKIYKPQWFPRTWQFLDPEKDARASALLIKTGLSKYRDELGSLGLNWRKHLREIKEEQDFIKELGIELSLDTAGGISPQQDQSQGNTNDTVTPNDGVVPFKKVAP